jgi:STAS-like domain of unknown function (DUF4325)
MNRLRIADYASSPGGRFISDGEFSGEWFREQILAPALLAAQDKSEMLKVELDGTSGYGSSFLEEAFGGLVRKGIADSNTLRRVLIIAATSPLYAPYKALAERYIATAKREMVAA